MIAEGTFRPLATRKDKTVGQADIGHPEGTFTLERAGKCRQTESWDRPMGDFEKIWDSEL